MSEFQRPNYRRHSQDPKRPGAKSRTEFVPPASPEHYGVLDFFERVYLHENPRLATERSARSIDDYRIQISILQQFFDLQNEECGRKSRSLKLRDLTNELVSRCVAWRIEAGKSAATANKIIRTAKVLTRFAALNKQWAIKPVFVPSVPEAKRIPRAWSADELTAIVLAAREVPGAVGGVPANRFWTAMILTLVNTGLRVSAYMYCPTRGLDLERGVLFVPAEVQKHNMDHFFQLWPSTVSALRLLEPRRVACLGDDWPHDRTQNHWRSLIRGLRTIIVAAGLRESVADVESRDLFHKFRRSTASYVAQMHGAPRATEALGHSGSGVTQRYLDPAIAGFVNVPNMLPSAAALGLPGPPSAEGGDQHV